MLLESPNVIYWAALFLVIAFLAIRKYVQSPSYQLRHIPTIGSSGIIGSYFDSRRYFKEGRNMIQEGYDKYYGTPFKIPTMGRFTVVASGPQMIEDIRRASDDELSFREAVAETIQTDYMLGSQIRHEIFHITVVRTPLTRNIGYRFPDIKDEIITAFSELIPPTTEWSTIPALKTLMNITCRTSNRLFVGLPLCRNPDYRQLQEQFTLDVIRGAQTINKYPQLLRPIVGRYLTKIPANIKRVIKHVGPIIEERLAKRKDGNLKVDDESNDLISWLISEAPESQCTVEGIALRILTINFAAIHTTTMALTNVLYDLATHPEYVKPMREEVEAVIAAEGWTKVAMGKMRKVDSFIKETQRLAIGGLSMSRKALKDFTFSNGVTVPAGTHMAVATNATHVDGNLYSDPDRFDGFRFANKREEEGESLKHQMVSLSHEYVTFGTGRHACPGRFFAVNELKAMLAHILMTYDVKMPNDGLRPPSVWFQATCSPNPTAKVMFRKRVA
ncbi:cytochrome P450 [Pholiota conissans]|uniref:Cytochrome P450 n=1 Tax=Pholiota conissans TaxID=109636 RepID=A0A9P6CWE2_9AGAR|nr:cytochrome P450 [Pholiota conissans]